MAIGIWDVMLLVKLDTISLVRCGRATAISPHLLYYVI